ncbi:MAG: MFS transporter [Roseiflexaceae bacterium]|nr:MFS transporter [Roseiflexaceae bacterium]
MSARILSSMRTLSPAALLYLGAVTLVGFAVDGGVYTVLFNLYLVRLGYGPELIGLINGAAQLTFAISALPAGALGERYGSRNMLVIGLILMLFGCGLLPLADILPEAIRMIWLVGNEIILYFGLALYYVNTAPFLIGVIAPGRRSQVFGIQSFLLAIAAFVGGLVGGFLPAVFANAIGQTLESPAPYRFPLIIAALAMLPALFAIRAAKGGYTPSESAPGDTTHLEAAPTLLVPSVIVSAIVMMGVVRFLQVSGLAATTSFFNVYLDRALLVPTDQIGTISAFSRLLSAPAALATPFLARRFGNYWTCIIATLATGIMILPIAFIGHWSAASLSMIGILSVSTIRYTSSLVYFLELVPPERRATVSGVTEMSAGLSFTVMAFAGGYIITFLGYQALFLLGALLTMGGAGIFWWYYRRFQRVASSAK